MNNNITILFLLFFSIQIGFSQDQDINLTGNGNDIFNGGGNSPSTPNSTDFGDVEQEAIFQGMFTIENTLSGGSPNNNKLTVSDISISGIDLENFTVTGISLPIIINRGASTTFLVTYSSPCIGESNALVSITSDDPDENPYTFNVRANGVETGAGPTLILMETYAIDVLEPSGLTYDKVNNQLLTVSDNTAQIYRLSLTGDVLQTYNYLNGEDTEGVTFFTPGKVLFTEERSRELIEYDIANDVLISRHTMSYVPDDGDANSGIEGVSYDPATGTIFFLGEFPPVLVHANSSFTVTNEYPLTYAADISATYFVEETGHLWLASHEESTIYKCNTDGTIIYSFPITTATGIVIPQLEGIAIDHTNQILYAVSDVSEELYVFAICGVEPDTTPPVVNCTDISITLDGTGTAIITADDIDDCSYDFCGGINSLSISQTTFTCKDIGVNTVTLTVTDLSGNTATCDAFVTVIGTQTTFSGGSWDNGTPTLGSAAKFNSDYNTDLNGNVDACSCEIDAAATVTINAGGYLNVDGNINVNGTLIVEHQGSVVQINDNASVTNNGTINVNLSTPNLASRDFMVMGSPMTAETRNGVFTNAFLVLDHTTANFVPHPQVAIDFPLAENFADDNYDNWNAYSGAINPSEGYIVRPQAGFGQPGGVFNMTYALGTLNNGDINFNVLFNNNKNDSPNVLANPYPSAIWANDFINANTMIDEVYFWEHLTPPSSNLPGAGAMNFSMEDISMYNLSGGIEAASDTGTSTTPNGYISTGQGFGIKATAAGTAVFNNAMRRTTDNNTLRTPENNNKIWLQVSNADYQMQKSTLIAFTPLASQEIDPGYDSRRLATIVSIYSHLEDGSQELGIQSRETFEDGIKVLLGFSTMIEEELEYTITIANIQGDAINNATVYLIDNQEQIITNLNETTYTFKSNKGTFNSRFTLLFEEYQILNNPNATLEAITLYPNPTKHIINIVSPQTEITNITVFDVMGRKVYSKDVNQQKNCQVDISNLEATMYFVKINTQKGAITKQIIKK